LVVEPTPLKNMLVKLESSPNRDEHKKSVWNHHLGFGSSSQTLKTGYFKLIFLDAYLQTGISQGFKSSYVNIYKPPTTRNLSSCTLLSISPAWFSGMWASCPPKIEGITMITASGRGDITNTYVHKQLAKMPLATGHFPTPQNKISIISNRTLPLSSHSSEGRDDQNCIFCTTVPNPTKTQHTSAMSVVGESPELPTTC